MSLTSPYLIASHRNGYYDIGTLAVDGWAVVKTGTVRKVLGGISHVRATLHCTRCNSPPSVIILPYNGILLWAFMCSLKVCNCIEVCCYIVCQCCLSYWCHCVSVLFFFCVKLCSSCTFSVTELDRNPCKMTFWTKKNEFLTTCTRLWFCRSFLEKCTSEQWALPIWTMINTVMSAARCLFQLEIQYRTYHFAMMLVYVGGQCISSSEDL